MGARVYSRRCELPYKKNASVPSLSTGVETRLRLLSPPPLHFLFFCFLVVIFLSLFFLFPFLFVFSYVWFCYLAGRLNACMRVLLFFLCLYICVPMPFSFGSGTMHGIGT